MNTDSELFIISATVGNIYCDFKNIHTSFSEAENTLCIASDSKVYLYSDYKISLYLSKENIRTLQSYIVNYQAKDAANLVQTILISDTIKEADKIQLYNLYFAILKYTESFLKEINIKGKYFSELFFLIKANDKILLDPQYFIKKYSAVLIENIDSTKNKNNNIDIRYISQYIDHHFEEDLYLEMFASKFNITTQYLSKIFKEKMGITFYDYISYTRINHAKELLAFTKQSIDEISIKCGFNSRHTFIRMCKKYEEITPGEYRKNSKKI